MFNVNKCEKKNQSKIFLNNKNKKLFLKLFSRPCQFHLSYLKLQCQGRGFKHMINALLRVCYYQIL